MSVGEKTTGTKQQRRGQIMDAARRLFWERGYRGTTMPEIAREAGLAAGTLYLYFPGKGALYAELLFAGYDLLIERLGAELNRGGETRDRGEALIDAFLGFARDFPEYFDIIFFVLQRESREGAKGSLDAEQLDRLRAREAACKAMAAQMLRQAGYTGDQPVTVDAIWSMLVGVVFYFRKTGPDRFAAVTAEAKRLILDGVLGET
ncbi:MAG: TetR/AcrR family transcriptional regulator [Candidatus Brocadiia bacterium]